MYIFHSPFFLLLFYRTIYLSTSFTSAVEPQQLMQPHIRYTKGRDVHIAYQVFGAGTAF
jgi:hypothetical protein